MNPSWSLNPVDAANQLLAYPFMVNAYLAGSIVAVTAAVVGWFMVLRRQAFAGHTLAVIAFPGAAGASLIGAPALVGYYAASTVGAGVLGRVSSTLAPGSSGESAAIGTLQACGLAAGFLFVSLYHGLLDDLNALLFGTFLGISHTQVVTLAIVSAASLVAIIVVARPLLFASIDRDLAVAGGVPARVIDMGFLLVLAVTVAATSQITGVLLVFALLVAPAATAQRLTSRPALSIALAVTISMAVTWAGLAAAYFTVYPVGFYVTALATAAYALAWLVDHTRRRWC